MTQPQQYLHSIMVQLLFLSPTKPSERSLIYIPLWFNYYSYRFCQRKPSDSIYIPLWFNYYQDGVLKTHDTPAFTFHYGSITILKTINRANKERIFTFHYGSITIKTPSEPHMALTTFTFHYGSITIRPLLYPTLSSFYNPLFVYLNFFYSFLSLYKK